MKKTINILALAATLAIATPMHAQGEVDITALNNIPAVTLADALTGLMPTARIEGGKIYLRGNFSTSGASALVLVDGVEIPLDKVDPSTVESVKVLQGGSAAAIYGARASAGAVIVTTKNAGALTGSESSIRIQSFAGLNNNTHKVSVRGGNEGFSYFFGANYYGNDGVMKKSASDGDYHKAGLTGNMNARINSWLRYSMSLDYAFQSERNPSRNADASAGYASGNAHYIMMKNTLSARIIEGLELEASYAFTNDYDFLRERNLIVPGNPESVNSYAEGRFRTTDNDFDARINFERTFGGEHSVSACAGTDIQSGMHKKVGVGVGNLTDPAFSVLTIGDGKFDVKEEKARFTQIGIFANAAYSYDGRYSANLTFREDGSSKLPTKNRWNPSFAASAEWNLRKEAFFSASEDVVSKLNIRLSASSIANHGIAPAFGYYNTIAPVAGTSDFLFDRSGLGHYSTYSGAISENLRPERMNTVELGADAAFLGGRLSVSAAAYGKKVTDMLSANAIVSAMLGISAPYMNQGSATAIGGELCARWSDDACGKQLHYSVGASFDGHSNSLNSIYDPRAAFTLDASLRYKGLDAGMNIYGYENNIGIGTISAGYTFDFGPQAVVKALRLGLCARNIRLSGIKIPAAGLLNLNINF